ncbi:glycosyl hydrolase family 57 [Coraliomargarita sinensis]|uniref:Glycosyl hydrolase family 57 n=1 Tax=Coraliomargarita sinensis TaxID=2174842 RepID=A0A317ZGV5_9BACT|nr:glycosyl hydrolase family 57 [Coraliomargarita sinensis]
MESIPEYIDDIPNIAGSEELIESTIKKAAGTSPYAGDKSVSFEKTKAAFAIALHQHQPLIPARGDITKTPLISNLKDMMDHPDEGDNHNASVFKWCYERMGDFIPDLVGQGKEPRCMLEYSGTLLHGLRDMGCGDVVDKLKHITVNPDYRRCVEWLGMPWGHAVAPSTPVQDYRLHVKAFQHHFAAIFGLEALERLRGFSPSEMALPNHPDIAYEYIKTLVDCGYQWLLVQEHTVEQPGNGHGPERKHLPHRLVVRNSEGKEVSMIAIIKTQGSDTKLVAQMQPYHEARSLDRWELAGKKVPPLVTQIADGENGGVMMNEFPPMFNQVMQECSHSDTPAMNVSEYLDKLFGMGIKVEDFDVIQPIHQKKIWDRIEPGCGSEKLGATIEAIKKEDHEFHMEGGSWTNSISWVEGYDNVLGPMEEASYAFYEKVLKPGHPTDETRFRKALFNLMSSQTSCYRYWGQGAWTDFGVEICRRVKAIVENDY